MARGGDAKWGGSRAWRKSSMGMGRTLEWNENVPGAEQPSQSATSFAMTALALRVAARARRRKPAGSSSSESDEAYFLLVSYGR